MRQPSSFKQTNSFQLKNLLEEGWALTQLNKWFMLKLLMLMAVSSVLIVALILSFFGVTQLSELGDDLRLGIDLALIAFTAPFFSSLLLAGLAQSLGQKPSIKLLSASMGKSAVLAITALAAALITQLGLILFIVPGLYLAIATGFSLLLVIDKRCTPMQAIYQSIRMVNRYWFAFIKLHCVFTLLFAISVMTLGIAFIWVIPLYYNTKGILYRDLFEVKMQDCTDDDRQNGLQKQSASQKPDKKQESNQDQNDHDGFFNA